MLTITNSGPRITASNYWGSSLDKAGLLYLSCNAGAFRLLLPSGWESAVEELATGREVVVSRGPWKQARGFGDAAVGRDSFEMLFDDGTEEPYAIHLDAAHVDRLPTAADAAGTWICTVWVGRGGMPSQVLERPAWYRVVEAIPCLKPRGN